MIGKPSSTKVYLPIYLKDKFVRNEVIGSFSFTDIKVGDTFFMEKLSGNDIDLKKRKTRKVASVIYSTFDYGNIVILEPKICQNENELKLKT